MGTQVWKVTKKKESDVVGVGLGVLLPANECVPRRCQSALHAAVPDSSSCPTWGSRDVADQAAQAALVPWVNKSPSKRIGPVVSEYPEAAEFSYGGFFSSELLLFPVSHRTVGWRRHRLMEEDLVRCKVPSSLQGSGGGGRKLLNMLMATH